MQTKPKPHFKDGSKVVYRGIIFKVIDSYYKDYPHSQGWFYNLDHFDCQRIPENQLSPA